VAIAVRNKRRRHENDEFRESEKLSSAERKSTASQPRDAERAATAARKKRKREENSTYRQVESSMTTAREINRCSLIRKAEEKQLTV
jgi:hypothetical protein